MGDSSATYIHMVQHLIEESLLFKMNQEECAEALSKHANIQPVITNTVWKELEKENREFFEQHAKNRQDSITASTIESAERIKEVITAAAARHTKSEDEDED